MLDLAPIFREALKHDPSLITTAFDVDQKSVASISCTIREGWIVDGVFEISGSGEAAINDVYAFLAEYQISDGYKPDPNTRYALDGITKYAMSERTVDTHKWSEAATRGLSNDYVYIPTRVADYGLLYAPSSTALLADSDFDIAVYSSYDDDDALIDTQFLIMDSTPQYVNAVGAFYGNVDANAIVDLTGAKYYTIQFGKETAFPVYTPSSRVYFFYIVVRTTKRL